MLQDTTSSDAIALIQHDRVETSLHKLADQVEIQTSFTIIAQELFIST